MGCHDKLPGAWGVWAAPFAQSHTTLAGIVQGSSYVHSPRPLSWSRVLSSCLAQWNADQQKTLSAEKSGLETGWKG